MSVNFAIPSSEQHTFAQRAFHVFVDHAGHAHRVLAIESGRRMHQQVRQCAIVGQQEQSAGVDVEPPDDDPPPTRKFGQPVETRRPAFRIAARAHHVVGFVHDQHARGGFGAMVQRRAVDGYLVFGPNPVAQPGAGCR
jgi:hypothetical protein